MLLFFIGEYGHMMVGSAMFISLYLGGYGIPWVTPEVIQDFFASMGNGPSAVSVYTALVYFGSFLIKLGLLLWIFIWVRWTLPRFRYDQLMDLGWKTMLPWALANTIITAIVMQMAHS